MKKAPIFAAVAGTAALFGCGTTPVKTNAFEYRVDDCAVTLLGVPNDTTSITKEYDFGAKTLTTWTVTADKTTRRAEFQYRDKPFGELGWGERAEARRLAPLLPKACDKNVP